MKTILKVSMFALAIVFVQACGSKSKEATSDLTSATSVEPTAEEKAAQALKEKQDAIHKRELAQQERLRKAAERRAAEDKYYKDASGKIIYNRAEVAPAFPGGEKAMMEYFRKNLKYPAEAESKGWEGTIYVDFVVDKDGVVRGSVVTEETDEDADQSLRNEAIRVVDNMPRWVPGRQLGEPVHVKYNLPVAFRINNL